MDNMFSDERCSTLPEKNRRIDLFVCCNLLQPTSCYVRDPSWPQKFGLMNPIIKLFIAASGILSLPAQAALLAQYDFNGNLAATPPLPTGITSAGNLSAGAGFSEALPSAPLTGTGISGNPANTFYIRSSTVDETTIADAITAASYLTFQLNITPGYMLDLSSVELSHWVGRPAGSSYTSNLAVYYTADPVTEFTSETVAVKLGEHSTSSQTIEAAQFTQNLAGNESLTGTVHFYFVLWDPNSTNLDNHVTRVDSIQVHGVLSAIPEPSVITLSALAVMVPTLRRRRRS